MDYPGMNPTSSSRWLGADPVTTVFYIDAGADGSVSNFVADPGAVIVSEMLSASWIFSTITTPESGSQPFSGNRQFGLRILENGNVDFYTRAADRAKLSPLMKVMINDNCSYKDYFDIGDLTWYNLISEITKFIQDNGGAAARNRRDFVRVDYENLKKQLKSESPINIECN